MNKRDFLNYIVFQCSKCIFHYRDCAYMYCDIFKTSRLLRGLFTWNTHHFEELLENETVSMAIARRGDVYFIYVMKTPFVSVLVCGWYVTHNKYIGHTSNKEVVEVYYDGTVKIITYDKTVAITPETLKNKINHNAFILYPASSMAFRMSF